MNIRRTKVIAFLVGFLIVIALLLSAVLSIGSSKEAYKKSQLDLDIASYAGTDQETLDYASETLIDYIVDERDNLQIEGVIFNTKTSIYNEKEMAHMVDVKNLFMTGRMVVYVSLIIAILLFVFEITTNREAFNYKFFKSAAISMVGVLILFILIGVYAALDFSSFWTNFHKVFFTNDLYLLNPNTDFLIRMMPLDFFISIVSKIAIKFSIMYTLAVASFVSCHYLLKGSKSK